MEAVILAGGKGTRLQPLTAEIPKPLVSVGERPIVEILLTQMARHGVTRAHLCVNHLAHLLKAVLSDGEHLGLNVSYANEDQPLSTVAPIAAIDNLPPHFIVANGDILTDLDFTALYNQHQAGSALVTVATVERTVPYDYGVLDVDGEGQVRSFREKPALGVTVSAGIYVFSREVLALVPPATPFGFDNLMSRMLEDRLPIATFLHRGYWLDIGRWEDYRQAQLDIKELDWAPQ